MGSFKGDIPRSAAEKAITLARNVLAEHDDCFLSLKADNMEGKLLFSITIEVGYDEAIDLTKQLFTLGGLPTDNIEEAINAIDEWEEEYGAGPRPLSV